MYMNYIKWINSLFVAHVILLQLLFCSGAVGAGDQILADKKTLSQPGGPDYAHHITTCPPPPDLPTALFSLLTFLNNSVFICFSDQKSKKKTTNIALYISEYLQEKQINEFFKHGCRILTKKVD